MKQGMNFFKLSLLSIFLFQSLISDDDSYTAVGHRYRYPASTKHYLGFKYPGSQKHHPKVLTTKKQSVLPVDISTTQVIKPVITQVITTTEPVTNKPITKSTDTIITKSLDTNATKPVISKPITKPIVTKPTGSTSITTKPITKDHPSNSIQPTKPVKHQVQTMDLILEQAGDVEHRDNNAITKQLAPYVQSDMFDNADTLNVFDKALEIDGYAKALAQSDRLSSKDAGKETLDVQDTTDLLAQKAVRPLSLHEELFLFNKAVGTPLRLLSINLHLFPSLIAQKDLALKEPLSRAHAMGKIIMQCPDDYDVIVVQEAWDQTCRDAFYDEIKDVYPSRIEDNYQSYMSVLKLNAVVGTGLAIYSKYPFETIVTPAQKQQNYLLEAFSDYRADDLFSYEGFLLVKLLMGKDKIPAYIVTTHLKAEDTDWDHYAPQAAAASEQTTALEKMEQIKSVLRFIIMYDYYNSDLNAISKTCKSDSPGMFGYLKQYIFNLGKQVDSKKVNTMLRDAKELQCMADAIKSFSDKKADFWNQAYIFIAGNLALSDFEILSLFGKGAQTIMKVDAVKPTSSTTSTRPNHILSVGKKPAESSDGSMAGGSYIFRFSNHALTDPLGLGLCVKLTK